MWFIVHRQRTCQPSCLKSLQPPHHKMKLPPSLITNSSLHVVGDITSFQSNGSIDPLQIQLGSNVLRFNNCIQTYLLHMLIITFWSQVLQERQQSMKIKRQRKVTCNPQSLLDKGDVRDKEKLAVKSLLVVHSYFILVSCQFPCQISIGFNYVLDCNSLVGGYLKREQD